MSDSQAHKSGASRRYFIMDISDKMNLLAISLISAFVHMASQNPLDQFTLQPNVLVLEVDGSRSTHNLTCLNSPEELMRGDDNGLNLIWKKDGAREPTRGNTYEVELEETLGGGNYTCHDKDGALVNHTVVLIKDGKTEERRILKSESGENYLDCSARNYSGEFHCSWTWQSGGKLAFVRVYRRSEALCSADASGLNWECSSEGGRFRCSADPGGRGVTCVDEQHCPFSEESRHIHVEVYVTTESFLLEVYSKKFYLSQIVKPDRVEISEVNKTVTWTYPSSWSSPYSYFPLTFQIKQLKGQCRKCENPCDQREATRQLVHSDICRLEVKRSTKVVCVRAKDPLCNSRWSEWSHFRLRRNKDPSLQRRGA